MELLLCGILLLVNLKHRSYICYTLDLCCFLLSLWLMYFGDPVSCKSSDFDSYIILNDTEFANEMVVHYELSLWS